MFSAKIRTYYLFNVKVQVESQVILSCKSSKQRLQSTCLIYNTWYLYEYCYWYDCYNAYDEMYNTL